MVSKFWLKRVTERHTREAASGRRSRRNRVGVHPAAACDHVFRNPYGSQEQHYVTGCEC